jgi:hypothetical protein
MLFRGPERMATMPAPVLTAAMIDPERQEAPDFRRVP